MGLAAAIVAASAALITAWLANFAGEEYRRFQRGTVVAAALLGELRSYIEGFEMGRESTEVIRRHVKVGGALHLPRNFKGGNDFALEAAGIDIGLLGPEICEGLAFVYNSFRSARLSLEAISAGQDETPSEIAGHIFIEVANARERACERGKGLVELLSKRADARWKFRDLTAMFGR